MEPIEVFVALGGNIGDTPVILRKALMLIENLPKVASLRISRFYTTTPVVVDTQDNFTNAVCSFETTYTARELLHHLQEIERRLGKTSKPRNSSRTIDLDILFFGREKCKELDLEIPHPRWMERRFVLVPLADLTLYPKLPGNRELDLLRWIKEFPNPHKEAEPIPQEVSVATKIIPKIDEILVG